MIGLGNAGESEKVATVMNMHPGRPTTPVKTARVNVVVSMKPSLFLEVAAGLRVEYLSAVPLDEFEAFPCWRERPRLLEEDDGLATFSTEALETLSDQFRSVGHGYSFRFAATSRATRLGVGLLPRALEMP